jgi:hypothetical protein
MLHYNATTRVYAETIGRSLTFGHDIISCDPFMNPVSYGWFFLTETKYEWNIFDVEGGFIEWHKLIHRGQAHATEDNVDPASYGVYIEAIGDKIRGFIVRVSRSESTIRDMHTKPFADHGDIFHKRGEELEIVGVL